MDTQMGEQEGDRTLCPCGREGRKERVDKQRRQVWWPPPWSSLHNSHGSRGWMEANAHSHKHRETRAHRGCPVGHGASCHPSTLGGSPPSLGAHDLARPRLVGSVWGQLGEHHLHSLELLVLGRDGTHLIGHLVALHRHVLPLDV